MNETPQKPPTQPTPSVLMRADAVPDMGVGHAMRLLALAQELRGRGVTVCMAGSLEIDWVAHAYADAGVELLPPPADAEGMAVLAERVGAQLCVLDRYDLDDGYAATLRAHGLRVMVMVDGSYSAQQQADLYVDQNPGALPRAVARGQTALAGASYTLFRDDVLALRRGGELGMQVGRSGRTEDTMRGTTLNDEPPSAPRPFRVLAVFGGTDPCGAAPVVTPLILDAAARTGRALDLSVITPDDAWAAPLRADPANGITLTTTGALPDLAARAAASDLVITASGSSVWELLCLGVPIGVVCVIDNQRPGYDMVVAENLALGVGHLDDLRDEPAVRSAAVDALVATLEDTDVRAERVSRGQALLDGQGRRRVADALLALAR